MSDIAQRQGLARRIVRPVEIEECRFFRQIRKQIFRSCSASFPFPHWDTAVLKPETSCALNHIRESGEKAYDLISNTLRKKIVQAIDSGNTAVREKEHIFRQLCIILPERTDALIQACIMGIVLQMMEIHLPDSLCCRIRVSIRVYAHRTVQQQFGIRRGRHCIASGQDGQRLAKRVIHLITSLPDRREHCHRFSRH